MKLSSTVGWSALALAVTTLSAPAHADTPARFPADAGVIDVTDPMWGVVPDDGQDDSAALQRVFDLLTPNGKIVYFPDGRYDLETPVRLRKSDIVSTLDDFEHEGWDLEEVGGRTALVARDTGTGPDDAGRITYRFDAIQGERRVRFNLRAAGDQANTFFWRLNGGEWRQGGVSFDGNTATDTDWRDRQIVSPGEDLVTGENTIEIAARQAGFAIEGVSLDYGANYLSNTILQGESKRGTILRSGQFMRDADGEPVSGAILGWEPGVEQFFRTSVRDMTIVVRQGNPELDGLAFHGSNQSRIDNVILRAAPGSGDVGLDMVFSAGIGPLLVSNTAVYGFKIGIHTGWQNTMRNFYNIRLGRQEELGWLNEAAANIVASRIGSNNDVPAFYNVPQRLPGDGNGRVVLTDSTFKTREGAEPGTPAITTNGIMYARNVRTPGYDTAIVNVNQEGFRGFSGQDGIDGDYIDEWWSAGAYAGQGGGFTRLWDDAPDTSLRLWMPRQPKIPMDTLDTWDGPHRHPIGLPDGTVSGLPDDGVDDTPSLQAAIDSGAGTVYLPNGNWDIAGTVELRGNVARLIGTEASVSTEIAGAQPRIVIGPDGPKNVVIERLSSFEFLGARPVFEHASDRTVIFESVTGLDYRPTVDRPGFLYLNDTVGRSILFRNQRVFANQLNIEVDNTEPEGLLDAKIVNDNSRVRVLGFKTEDPGVHVRTINGGYTEILGQHHLNDFGSSTPQYITEDAGLSVVVNIKPYAEAGTTYGTVEETRNGETRTGTIAGVGYAGFGPRDLWVTRREIILDDDSATGVEIEGEWTQDAGFPRGFIGSGFSYAAPSAANAITYRPQIPSSALYEVFARWPARWGGQARGEHSTQTTFEVTHLEGTTPVTVDQRPYSDGWHSLGTFRFAKGTNGSVRVSGAGANGTVVTDGVRFRRRNG